MHASAPALLCETSDSLQHTAFAPACPRTWPGACVCLCDPQRCVCAESQIAWALRPQLDINRPIIHWLTPFVCDSSCNFVHLAPDERGVYVLICCTSSRLRSYSVSITHRGRA